MSPILQSLITAICSGIVVGITVALFNKYSTKSDNAEVKVSSLEGAIGGVSDKAFMAIKNLDEKVTIYNREREKEIVSVKDIITAFEKNINEKIENKFQTLQVQIRKDGDR